MKNNKIVIFKYTIYQYKDRVSNENVLIFI